MKVRRVHNRQEVFLAAYRVACSIVKAAEAADMERGMHYRWLREDPEYKAAFDVAHEEATQALEDEAVRRAHEGIEEPLVYQGQFTYAAYNKKTKKGIGRPLALRKYSDALLMFLLRGAKPEKYRERFQAKANMSTADGGSIQIEFVTPMASDG